MACLGTDISVFVIFSVTLYNPVKKVTDVSEGRSHSIFSVELSFPYTSNFILILTTAVGQKII
jgi:hypothetical protein